jgi:hypothetical protein
MTVKIHMQLPVLSTSNTVLDGEIHLLTGTPREELTPSEALKISELLFEYAHKLKNIKANIEKDLKR